MDQVDVNIGPDAFANKFRLLYGNAGQNTQITLDQSATREEKLHVEELRPESFVMNFLQKKTKKQVENATEAGDKFKEMGLASPS